MSTFRKIIKYKIHLIFCVAIFMFLIMGIKHVIYNNNNNNRPLLLVLCTTFVPSFNRQTVHNNTMQNWKKLGLNILPVLFLEEKYKDTKLSFLQSGWHVFPVKHAIVDRTPILRHFFIKIRRTYKAKYIGYANADILFNDDLLKTINVVEKYRRYFISENEIFISGCRFDIRDVSTLDFSSSEKIKQIKLRESSKHPPHGQDYFITDFNYHWDILPDIVVGKQRVDNWILINAIENNHSAIDASESITALHQTVDFGSWESSKLESNLSDYNENLLTSMYGTIYFYTGSLNCLPLVLSHTLAPGEVVLFKRVHYPHYCRRQEEIKDMIKRKQRMEQQQKLLEIERKKKLQGNVQTKVTKKSSVKRNIIYG